MHKVSSKFTYFHTTIFQWIIIALLLIGIFLYLILGLSSTFLFFIIYCFLIFYLPWFFTSRKYKTVFMGKDFFQVDEEIIPFNTIKSINKHLISPSFIVNYTINNINKRFSFLPKYYFPFLTPYYIKEIRESIKNKKHKV